MWWLRLRIQLERTKPGHPQQDGRHERLYLTLKKEKVNLSHVFAGQNVGVTQVGERIRPAIRSRASL